VQVGNSSRFFAVPLLRGSFFLKSSAHRSCGVVPGVGMRHAHANEPQPTPCVTATTDCFREKLARCQTGDILSADAARPEKFFDLPLGP
jgi:hypothetical protein